MLVVEVNWIFMLSRMYQALTNLSQATNEKIYSQVISDVK